MKIALISCTKLKEDKPCVASQMYKKSPLFRKASAYAGLHYNHWYILSAEFGLVHPSLFIWPYDKTLNKMSAGEVLEWAEMVSDDILAMRPTEVDFYAGERYRKYLIPFLESEGIRCNVPLKGLGIGQQLQFYKENGK